MDTYSQISMDSEDSVPRNVYEEVIVDSTIHPFDPKADVVGDYTEADSSMLKDAEQASETATEEETDDDEEMESTSSGSSVPVEDPLSAKEKYSEATIVSTEKPSNQSTNLKLVLKKSPEYQLASNSTQQSKNSQNKIILVTLVSSTNTTPGHSALKYSVASETSVDKPTEMNKSMEDVRNQENSEDSNPAVLRPIPIEGKPIKTYGRVVASGGNSVESTKIEREKDTESVGKDENDEIESIKSETDSKTSTPKIRRELKQLQKTVNESKILSEFMSESNSMKIRKTRKAVPLKDELNVEISPIQAMRSRSQSCSKPRTDSPVENTKLDRWPSEEKINKRQNMRSQNSEFVQKHMKFLNSIQQSGGDEITDNSDGEQSITDGKSSSHSNVDQPPVMVAAKRELHPPPKPGWDMFCFKCHSGCDLIACSKCIRSYHTKCVKNPSPSKFTTMIWSCPECVSIETFLKNSSMRSKSTFTVENLSQLLLFALKRMKQTKGSDAFLTMPTDEEYPEYSKYIINPMPIEKLQNKIEKNFYKCSEDFAVDAKWILHNCMVYFGNNSKITPIAKTLVKVCRQEITEIDTCSECYYNANTRKDWFVEVCSRPHTLVWAKLKGFPYWPAKAMGVNSSLVNVRFFGAHDRAYVPIKECFLYSEKDPNPPTKQNKRNTIAECVKEVEIYIRNLTAKFGSFIYPPFRTIYDPNKEMQQLEMMIPGIADILNSAEKASKPALTYRIVKTADNHLSIIKKSDKIEDNSNSSNSGSEALNSIQANLRKHRDKPPDVQPTTTDPKPIENSSQNESVMETEIETRSSPVKLVVLKKPAEKSENDQPKTYEVVSKVGDSEQTKVNSVILKRKSDNWNAVTQVASKKSKPEAVTAPVPEIEIVEKVTHKPEVVESSTAISIIENSPAKSTIDSTKRKRSREENVSRVQKTKLDDDKIPPLVLLSQPYVMSSASSVLASTSGTGINSNLNVFSNLNSSVTVTITQSPAIVTTPSETTSSQLLSSICSVKQQLDSSEISIKPIPKRVPQQSQPPPVLNVTNNENSDNPIVSINKESFVETEKSSTDNLTKSKDSDIPTTATTEPRRISSLIPFDEIKTEKPDIDETPIEVRSKTASPEQQQHISGKSVPNCSDINFKNVVIKQEITSDDEESSNASRSEENGETGSSLLSAAQALDPRDGKLSQINQKTAEKKKIGVIKAESTKQRARKSFPNRSHFNPIALTSISISTAASKRNSLPQSFMGQNNSMVYIPVDPKLASSSNQNSPAIPTFTTATTKTSLASPLPVNSSISNPISNISSIPAAVSQSTATLLTTSVQLPIVYSTVSVSTNGPSSGGGSTGGPSQSNNTNLQLNAQSGQSKTISSDHMLSGFVTPTLASAITDAIVKGPPKLVPRPTGPFRSDGDYTFPTAAGPVSKLLMENAHKMTDFFRSVIEDSLSDMANNHNLEGKIRLLELELEKMRYTHEKEIAELKHNTDMMLCEMRKSMENEKSRLIAETRKQCELERIRAVEDAKTKQWCAACGKEAQFYCCWNTSYCDYPCQQKHWSRHMNSCAQKDNNDANAQRIGVKVSSYNATITAKDRLNKAKDPVTAPKPIQSAFIRAQIPLPSRSSVPGVRRLIPITTQPSPRYTLINNNDGNWGLVPSAQFPRILPPTGLIMSDGNNKTHPPTQLPGAAIIRATKL